LDRFLALPVFGEGEGALLAAGRELARCDRGWRGACRKSRHGVAFLEQKKRKSEQYCAWLFNSRSGTITNLGRTARNCVTGIEGL
jgi:hypothetical protein